MVKPKVVLQSFFVLLVGLGDLRAQVQEYNTKNPENAVQEGDHIVSVNGSSQDTEMVISADFIGSRKLHSCVLLRIKENGCPSWKIDRSDKRPWA